MNDSVNRVFTMEKEFLHPRLLKKEAKYKI